MTVLKVTTFGETQAAFISGKDPQRRAVVLPGVVARLDDGGEGDDVRLFYGLLALASEMDTVVKPNSKRRSRIITAGKLPSYRRRRTERTASTVVLMFHLACPAKTVVTVIYYGNGRRLCYERCYARMTRPSRRVQSAVRPCAGMVEGLVW